MIKFRRGDDLARTQLTWLFVVGALVGLYPFVCLLEIAISGTTGWISGVLALFIGVGLPLAFLAATAPKTLYRADWALSTALTYGALSLLVLSAYAAGTALTGLLTSNGSAAVAAVVAAACGVLLAPWRRRVQGLVDRRFFPRRRAVLLALADLQRRINDGTGQPEEIEEVLREALRDPTVRVGLRLPGELESRDLAGQPLTGESIPVLLAGQPVGALTASSPVVRAVLADCVSAAAPLVEIVRLRVQLSTALHEVAASRARLVEAGTAERVRLERDLHDGAQQRLVALGMAIRVSQQSMPAQDPTYALLDHAVAQLQAAVVELREIAHGIRPSSLQDGLGAALDAWSQGLSSAVEVDAEVGELSDEVATTAYFVAAEAVTNAAKHADAQRISVTVRQDDSAVMISVTDDGRGGASVPAGSGLARLADRVAALSGTFTVDSPLGEGTRVEAVLPCGS